MSRRRRLRSTRVARRVAKAAAAALVCVGSGGRSVEAFSFPATTAAARPRCSTTCSSTAPAPQRQPHRLGISSAKPVLPSRHGSLGGAAVGDTMFVSRTSGWGSGRTAAASAAARRSRPPAPPALSMAADVLSALGKDALMFLAATVAVVPACKKLNIRSVLTCQVQGYGCALQRCLCLLFCYSGVRLCLLACRGLRTTCVPGAAQRTTSKHGNVEQPTHSIHCWTIGHLASLHTSGSLLCFSGLDNTDASLFGALRSVSPRFTCPVGLCV